MLSSVLLLLSCAPSTVDTALSLSDLSGSPSPGDGNALDLAERSGAPALSAEAGRVRIDGMVVDAVAWGRAGRLRALPEVAAEGMPGLAEDGTAEDDAAEDGTAGDGRAAILQPDGGLHLRHEGRIYRVAGLAAWDADGRRLPARLVAGDAVETGFQVDLHLVRRPGGAAVPVRRGVQLRHDGDGRLPDLG